MRTVHYLLVLSAIVAVMVSLWCSAPPASPPAAASHGALSAPRAARSERPAANHDVREAAREQTPRRVEAVAVTTAEEREAAQEDDDVLAAINRQRVFEANIANLYDAADVADAAGNGARASLMRKRAAALEGRMAQEDGE